MKQIIDQTYIAMIKNSVGSKMFKNNFFDIDGKKIDILENGSDSCAYFVSGVLKILDLIKNIHSTVDGSIKDILEYGRKEYKLKNIPIGAILVWEQLNGHKHIGFYIGNNLAISNSSKHKEIKKHSRDYRGKRKIEKAYVNIKLSRMI